jgi:hypothetical protein
VSRRLALISLLAALAGMAGCGTDEPSENERGQAIAAAKVAFDGAKQSGVDLDNGPCIAEELPGLEEWVADVAHDPREDVDDDPANQCQRYRDGEASHFVELTPEGELIRAE